MASLKLFPEPLRVPALRRQVLIVGPIPFDDNQPTSRAKHAQPFRHASLRIGQVPNDMARDDDVKDLILAVERAAVSNAEVNLESRPFCLAQRAVDHQWRKVDARDLVSELGESESDETGSTSDVEDLARSVDRSTATAFSRRTPSSPTSAEVRAHLHRAHARGHALWGDKVTRAPERRALGLPLLPGHGVLEDADDAVARGQAHRLPGDAQGLAAAAAAAACASCATRARCARASSRATAEAMAGFKNPDVYLERFIEEPRHIEFQVLADEHGGSGRSASASARCSAATRSSSKRRRARR